MFPLVEHGMIGASGTHGSARETESMATQNVETRRQNKIGYQHL
jgi:hypothetical protein